MGFGHVTYTAKRSLGPSHVVGTVYALPLRFTQATKSVEDIKRVQEALAGNTETLYYGQVRRWEIAICAMSLPEAVYVREFLDSTADGHIFQIDPYGSPDFPRQLMSVKREDAGYTEERALAKGSGGHDDLVVYRFTVRQT